MQIFFFFPGPTARGSDVIGLVSGTGHEGVKKLSSDSQAETYSSKQTQCEGRLGVSFTKTWSVFSTMFCEEHFKVDYGKLFLYRAR